MKKSKLIISALLLGILVVFSSCKNKDDSDSGSTSTKPTTTNGEIKLGGVTYKIASAVVQIITDSFEGESYAAITLTSVSLSGKAITVQLALIYPSSEGISGNYPLHTLFSDMPRYLDDWLSNYAIVQGMNMDNYNDLVSGTAKITDKGGNKFDISFKFKPRNGDEIEGTYSGTVTKQTVGV